MLLVDRYRGERVFLVGDAAHLNPPWGGHGFNTCVGDAATSDALRAEVAGALQVKDPEFHSLGLVLGYGYPDSPSSSRTARPDRSRR